MKFPFIRPAKMSDLSTLIQFSQEAGLGFTSLPYNPVILEKRLYDSEHAFRENLAQPTRESYLFCIESDNKVVGISGIISRVGISRPFFAYHLLHEALACPHLSVYRKTPVLHFIRAHKKPTEIGTLFVPKAFRQKDFGRLLSLSRFLFIASFKERFASTVIAELRGINQQGISPFWEAIGRPFFQVDFHKADLLRTDHPVCIEELFPKHPIYVELLSKEVQSVIGIAHPQALPAQKMLEKQGFKRSHYVDLFDAGPHLFAPTEEIHAIQASREATLHSLHPNEGPLALIANTRLDYRATIAPLFIKDGQATLHPNAASALQITPGDSIRYYSLS